MVVLFDFLEVEVSETFQCEWQAGTGESLARAVEGFAVELGMAVL